jgi:hypothetical protein
LQSGDSNLEAAASYLIREWAQKLLGEQFSNLRDLASHLIDKMCVDGRSVAAYALLSATNEAVDDQDSPQSMMDAKERDAHFERKVEQATSKRKGSMDSDKMEASAARPASGCKRQRMRNGRASVESPVRGRSSEVKKRPSPSASSSSVSPAPSSTKMPIPRLSSATATSTSRSTTPKLILISPSKQQPLVQPQQQPQQQPQPQTQQQQNKKYKRIQPKPEPPMDSGEEANFLTELNSGELLQEPLGIPNLEQSAFDEFLNGGNSQEQEDHELMTYFTHTAHSPVTGQFLLVSLFAASLALIST